MIRDYILYMVRYPYTLSQSCSQRQCSVERVWTRVSGLGCCLMLGVYGWGFMLGVYAWGWDVEAFFCKFSASFPRKSGGLRRFC